MTDKTKHWAIILGGTVVAGEIGRRSGQGAAGSAPVGAAAAIGAVAGLGVLIYAGFTEGVWGVVGALVAGGVYHAARGGIPALSQLGYRVESTAKGSAPSPLAKDTGP